MRPLKGVLIASLSDIRNFLRQRQQVPLTAYCFVKNEVLFMCIYVCDVEFDTRDEV